MIYFSALVFAMVMFTIVVLWSVVEYLIQSKSDEAFEPK